uniref:MYM-type domain-containing protein n=1 Tax=Clandestinovirus TaxID=2831644 RepID=A0A8F8KU50_9VIRU|nr:hypothetical protein KOM_12_410 [Clandestinovirus]
MQANGASENKKRGRKRTRDEAEGESSGKQIGFEDFMAVNDALEGSDGEDEMGNERSQSEEDDEDDQDDLDDDENQDDSASEDAVNERDGAYDIVGKDQDHDGQEHEDQADADGTDADMTTRALNNTSFSTCLVSNHKFKIIPQSDNVVHGQHNDGSIHCWWDSHPFMGKIHQIPCQRNDKLRRLYTYGCFCSWNCAMAWNISDPLHFRQKELRKTWLLEMAGCSSIVPAPSPVLLACKGAKNGLTIEEFREISRQGMNTRVILPTDVQEYRFVNQEPLLGYTLPATPTEKETALLKTVVEKITTQMQNPVDLNGVRFDIPIPQEIVQRLQEHQQQKPGEPSKNQNMATNDNMSIEEEDMSDLQNSITQSAYSAVMAKNRGRGSRGGRARPKPKRGLPPDHGAGGGLLRQMQESMDE